MTLPLIQIQRNGGDPLQGRLAQLLTEGPSPNPRWLVKFDGQPQKDEEMYERSFGKLLHSDEDDRASVPPHSASSGTTTSTTSAKASSGDLKNEESVLNDGEVAEDKSDGSFVKTNDRKNVQFHDGSTGGSDMDSETSGRRSTNRSFKDRVSAREARSRRRQAKIDEEAPAVGVEEVVGKRRAVLPPIASMSKSKRNRAGDGGNAGSEVVKVKLLTGTLYLYRGEQRRAEFVRRV